MAASPRDDLSINPAVRAADANKDLSLRNFRAKNRWAMIVKTIDIQKKEREHEIAEEQQKLLKYREKLQNSTLSLPSARKEDGMEEKAGSKSTSVFDVYRSLMGASRNSKEQIEINDLDDGNNNSPRDNNKSRGTVSSEQKRVLRKRFSYTLSDLQKANSAVQNKTADTSLITEEPIEERAPSRASSSVFSLTEDDEALGPLRLAPTSLPKIYQQSEFKPRTRRFDKDDLFKRHVREGGGDIEDVQYCRYLRTFGGGRRRNTVPVARFGQLNRNANKKH